MTALNDLERYALVRRNDRPAHTRLSHPYTIFIASALAR